MNKYRRISGLLLAFLPAACTHSPPGQDFTPLQAGAEESLLYLYRPQKMANALYAPDVHLDGTAGTGIKPGTHSVYRLDPGRHTISLAPGSQYTGERQVTIATAPGSTSYIRIDTTLELDTGSASYSPYRRSFNLVPVAPEQARTEITQCCNPVTDTLNNKDDNGTGSKPGSEGGFTTDKTQNPFGH